MRFPFARCLTCVRAVGQETSDTNHVGTFCVLLASILLVWIVPAKQATPSPMGMGL